MGIFLKEINKTWIIIALLLFATSCNNKNGQNEWRDILQKQNIEIEKLKSEVNLLKKELKNLPPIIGQEKQLEVRLSQTYPGDMSDYVEFVNILNNEDTYTFAWWSWALDKPDIFSFVKSNHDNIGRHFIIKIEYRAIDEIEYRPDPKLGFSVNVNTGRTINEWVLTNFELKN
jgi:hypothetical protein